MLRIDRKTKNVTFLNRGDKKKENKSSILWNENLLMRYGRRAGVYKDEIQKRLYHHVIPLNSLHFEEMERSPDLWSCEPLSVQPSSRKATSWTQSSNSISTLGLHILVHTLIFVKIFHMESSYSFPPYNRMDICVRIIEFLVLQSFFSLCKYGYSKDQAIRPSFNHMMKKP